MAPKKPEFGAACNGCGHCCKTITCPMARQFMKAMDAPCHALEWEGNRYWCGLLRHPARYMEIPEGLAQSLVSAYVTMALHVGDGCDDNSPAQT